MTVPENKVRSFSMYEAIEKPLRDFIREGDGVNTLPVFEEERYLEAEVVDATMINLVKLLSTGFGRARLAQAFKIVERIQSDNAKKTTLRFRSQHPLFVDGEPRYQNVCLVSGMVHLGIPILPYFDGEAVVEDIDNIDEYLARMRKENKDLF